jgi:voltage-gated potassium channel
MTWGLKDELTIRERAFEILERGRRGTLSHAFDIFIVVLILASVTISVIDTVETVRLEWGQTLRTVERFCSVIFIFEYLARLWVAPEHPMMARHSPAYARLRTAIKPIMVVDLLCISPLFIELLFGLDFAVIRLLRIARFYRLARYVPAIATIGRVLAAEWRSLLGSAVIFLGLLLIASAGMYLAERNVQPDKFPDIPSAMWWAAVTLSTVGYGDVVPVTLVGRLIAGFVMFGGILFFALPVGIIANGFQEEIRRRDFVVSFAMVARVPLFSSLDPPEIARLAGILRSRKFPSGSLVIARGEPADGMFFIVSGEVEVDVPGNPVRLGEGDFFGEMALIRRDALRTANVTAVRPCDLLELTTPDFRRLVSQIPDLDRAIRETAEIRSRANEGKQGGEDGGEGGGQ